MICISSPLFWSLILSNVTSEEAASISPVDLKACFCVSAAPLLSALPVQGKGSHDEDVYLKLWVMMLRASDYTNFFSPGASRESLLQPESTSPRCALSSSFLTYVQSSFSVHESSWGLRGKGHPRISSPPFVLRLLFSYNFCFIFHTLMMQHFCLFW